MKQLTLLFVLTAILAITGCSTENPLCTDNYCVEGEIYPRSELADDATFSEVEVDDARLLAAIGNIPAPVEITPDTDVNITETDVSTVIASLKADEPTFKGAFISVSAVVDRYTEDGSALYLQTPNNDNWIVRMFVKDYHFDISSIFANDGTSHKFILWISDFENNTIYARAVDPANIASGRSVLNQSGSTISTSVSEVIDSMKKGESFFIFKRILISATVVNLRESTIQSTGQSYEVLQLTENVSDLFHTKENHSFRIYPTVELWTEFDQEFTAGVSYTFELIVHYFSGRDFFDAKDIGVVTYLAE